MGKQNENQNELNVFQMYLDEIKGIQPCDSAENERLVREIASGSLDAKNRLIEGNLMLALGMTREYLNKGVQAGDLVQEANMALVMAAEELASEVKLASVEEVSSAAGLSSVAEVSTARKQASVEALILDNGGFEAVLENRVKEALKAVVAEQDQAVKVEEKILARIRVLEEVSRTMAEELGREATAEELAERMQMTVDEVKEIMKQTLDAMSVTGEYEKSLEDMVDGQ